MLVSPEFTEWCRDIRRRYEAEFAIKVPGAPNLGKLDSQISERMMRCAIEARHFKIEDYDPLAILAHHTLLQDDLRFYAGRQINDLERLYGYTRPVDKTG